MQATQTLHLHRNHCNDWDMACWQHTCSATPSLAASCTISLLMARVPDSYIHTDIPDSYIYTDTAMAGTLTVLPAKSSHASLGENLATSPGTKIATSPGVKSSWLTQAPSGLSQRGGERGKGEGEERTMGRGRKEGTRGAGKGKEGMGGERGWVGEGIGGKRQPWS